MPTTSSTGLLEKAYPNLRTTMEQRIADLQAAVLDASLADAERVDALFELRALDERVPDEQARTPAVLTAAVGIAASSDEPALRPCVWAQLAGADDPYVIQPLIDALAYDPSAVVRGAAAMLDDEARLRVARRTFFDTNVRARERMGALYRAFGRIGPGLPVDPDVADELFAIAVDPSDPEAGNTAWTLLVYAGELEPKLVDPLLSILDGESEMRPAAAAALGHFRELPAVREALERALHDPDRNVRNNAQRALECDYCRPAAR